MKRLLGIGLAAAVTFGAACGESDSKEGVEITAVQAVNVYKAPNAIHDPDDLAGSLQVGQRALALCYFESATLGADSVQIEDGIDGFPFIYNRDEAGHPVNNFDRSAQELRSSLDLCDQ